MRVVLDTNVLLSAFFKIDSPPYQLVQAWMDGRFEVVTGASQIEEIVRVARYPQIRRLLEPAEIGWLVNRLRDRAVILTRLPNVDASTDPADNFLFALAQAGKADYLVSGDKCGVLAIRRRGACQVVTARQFCALLKL
ncbi:MAG: putative toxin-antitoxin system toxin component, PIN family [Betaproteobacteria bacterium]